MPLIAPILDDRGFEELFAELRNRIPVYNPAWTDHLDSDPGITLLQLFAYLGEGLQFRFNQIPEATRISFLKLLGVPLRPARPAEALVRFTSKSANGVQLYAGDQVKAGKTRFSVTQDATLWPLDCVAVARAALLSETDQADDAKVRDYIAGLDPEVGAAVQASVDALTLADDDHVAPYEVRTLASDASGEPVDFAATVDGFVWIGVLLSPDAGLDLGQIADPNLGLRRQAGRRLSLSLGFSPAQAFPAIDDVAACGAEDGTSLIWQASRGALRTDNSVDYRPVRVAGDTTAGLTRAGVIRIELPDDLDTLGVPEPPAGLAGTGEYPPELDDERGDRLWFWLRVWRGDGSRFGEVRLLSLNTVGVVQATTAAPELLGAGTGQPGQVFQLAYAPVLIDERHPVKLQVEEAGVWTDWARADNLDAAGPNDRLFSIDAEAGSLHFGDGLAGRVPQLGERIRILGYRFGGGTVGNLPASAIAKLGDMLPGPTPPEPLRRPNQVDLKCANPLAATGGVDAESLDAALARIPKELRRNHRAVARDDFAELALETPAVALGRAECLPVFHAPSRSSKPGCVGVVVWPARDPQHPNAPLPDARELTLVCAWLDRWRLVTTELYVIPPTYRRIALAVSVKVRAGYGLDAVRDWVDILLRQYLAPLPPYGPDGHGWPLGRRVSVRELEAVAMQVEGVEYIAALRLDHATLADDGSETWTGIDACEADAWLDLKDWEVPEVAGISLVDDQTALPAPGAGLAPPPAKPAVPVPVLREQC